ncbi:MAG: hydratase [Treponema sp.]|jgi:aconitate hydratase|nr:hydratase [Treponema sp.]
MIRISDTGVYVFNGREILEDTPENAGVLQKRLPLDKDAPGRGTIAYGIIAAHNTSGNETKLRLKFDALTSHDITFVNIIQTARVSGLEAFPLPYILTNCHNSLCAVGGTINEDDHAFGFSAAKKYGGVYVPPHLGVIHSYIRETQAGCGRMILGSDSHTRYGALGAMGVGEGGGELVKQLLNQTYDIAYPKVIGVYLTGKPRPSVGPQDAALAIIGAVFRGGLVKNVVLEFIGDGVSGLSADFRCGIDVMTTETTCWSSIWETDEVIRDYLRVHNREGDYRKLNPGPVAYYDRMIWMDLSAVKPMIALPFHPSNVWEIAALLENPGDIFRKVEKDAAELIENPGIRFILTDKIDEYGRIRVDQGIIAGCAGGTYENIMAAAAILGEKSAGRDFFSLSVYPGSQPVLLDLTRKGCVSRLIASGAVVRTAFCGPCFGAGDVPANNGLSIRHTTRNFPNREGSRPMDGQIASVALMDSRSIAATARNGGFLTSAESFPEDAGIPPYHYDDAPYRNRVYNGVGLPRPEEPLHFGPNITGWPAMEDLGDHLLVRIVAFITDPVTTTDEIIPSGETSSYRSNPVGLAEFTLSRKDPAYVGRAKAVRQAEIARQGAVREAAGCSAFADLPDIAGVLAKIRLLPEGKGLDPGSLRIGSAIYAVKPGDGSAREQAASCQRVLGGAANFAREYATKRYRSNLINWGILPFSVEGEPPFKNGDYIFVPGIAAAVRGEEGSLKAYVIRKDGVSAFTLEKPELTPSEKEIILAGSLINFNKRNRKALSAGGTPG